MINKTDEYFILEKIKSNKESGEFVSNISQFEGGWWKNSHIENRPALEFTCNLSEALKYGSNEVDINYIIALCKRVEDRCSEDLYIRPCRININFTSYIIPENEFMIHEISNETLVEED